jgi:hypothetical protein
LEHLGRLHPVPEIGVEDPQGAEGDYTASAVSDPKAPSAKVLPSPHGKPPSPA